jgi:hypothetical protein
MDARKRAYDPAIHLLCKKAFREEDGPPETGLIRFRAFLVRKSDKSDLRWSSPRVTQSRRKQPVAATWRHCCLFASRGSDSLAAIE